MRKSASAMLLTALFSVGATAMVPPNYKLGEEIYLELMAGRKQLSQLTPAELEQLRKYQEAKRALEPRRLNTKSECIERERRSDPPSELEESMLDLKCSGLRE